MNYDPHITQNECNGFVDQSKITRLKKISRPAVVFFLLLLTSGDKNLIRVQKKNPPCKDEAGSDSKYRQNGPSSISISAPASYCLGSHG